MPQILLDAVRAGLMTEAEARRADQFADEVVERIKSGELTEEQAHELVIEAAIRHSQERLP